MKKIKIFLASSNELIKDRRSFEIEIYRKCKMWIDQGIFLHLEIWEDLTAAMSQTASQDEYDKKVKAADIFVVLAYTKAGKYTVNEFNQAKRQFSATDKPFIFTYFKNLPDDVNKRTKNYKTLMAFKKQVMELKHFYCPYDDFNDLWNQFNKELERLAKGDFLKNDFVLPNNASTRTINQGDKGIYIEKLDGGGTFNIQ